MAAKRKQIRVKRRQIGGRGIVVTEVGVEPLPPIRTRRELQAALKDMSDGAPVQPRPLPDLDAEMRDIERRVPGLQAAVVERYNRVEG